MCQYVVVDLEMCGVPKEVQTKDFHYANETIQIGAVLLNEAYEIVDRFDTYVCPEFGMIDSFIKNLTGITRKDVENAPKFAEAISAFTKWLPENVKFVEWSKNDLRQLRREIQGKNILVDRQEAFEAENWLDCQRAFAEQIESSRDYNLTEALNLAGIDYIDIAHNGYVDAYNTALLFARLQLEPERVMSDYNSRVGFGKKGLCCTIGDLFDGLQLASGM